MVGHPDNFYKLDTSKRVAAATLSFLGARSVRVFRRKSWTLLAQPPAARLGRLALPHLTI